MVTRSSEKIFNPVCYTGMDVHIIRVPIAKVEGNLVVTDEVLFSPLYHTLSSPGCGVSSLNNFLLCYLPD